MNITKQMQGIVGASLSERYVGLGELCLEIELLYMLCSNPLNLLDYASNNSLLYYALNSTHYVQLMIVLANQSC